MRRALQWIGGVSDYTFRWLITAWMVAFSIFAAYAWHRDEAVARSDEAEEEVDEAVTCVADWHVYVSVKAAIERSTAAGARAGAEALIRAAGSDPTPEEVENFRRLIGEAVAEETGPAVEVIAEPACDLDAAEARLREE